VVKRSNARPSSQRAKAGRLDRPAVTRAISLLEAAAALGRPATLAELAAEVDVPAATAHRLCQRLEESGYLMREGGSRRYSVGVRLLRLGLDVVRASGPTSLRRAIMSKLVDEIEETCNLTTLIGTEVLYLDRVETRWPLRLALEPGSRVPIHCTASGKLFLAHMPKEVRARMLSRLPLTAHAPNTIVTTRELELDLKRIAKRGFSTDNEEFLAGLVAVAVPVRDQRGTVFAAVATHAPIARLDLKALTAQVPRLVAAAERIAGTFE
jgi:DNA-binding IclR family transcriptional regulator